jgi:hypothetical protein
MKNIILATIISLTATFAFAGNNAAIRVTSGTKTDPNELAQLINDDSCFKNIFSSVKNFETQIQNNGHLNYLIKQAGPAEVHFNFVQTANDDLELKVTIRHYHTEGGTFAKQVMIPMGKKHVPDLNKCEQAVKLGFDGAISFLKKDSNDPETELGAIVRENTLAASQTPGQTGSQN